jgi:hypothetical protein
MAVKITTTKRITPLADKSTVNKTTTRITPLVHICNVNKTTTKRITPLAHISTVNKTTTKRITPLADISTQHNYNKTHHSSRSASGVIRFVVVILTAAYVS